MLAADAGAATALIALRPVDVAALARNQQRGVALAVTATRPVPPESIEARAKNTRKINQTPAEPDAAAHLAVDPERRSQWHFIGPVQSNKTADIAERFGWVQSLDRLKIARRLDDQRPNTLARLQVLIQVNISEEPSKSGINPDELLDFAHALSKFPRLKLRGLMAVPAPDDDGAHARLAKHFARLRHTAPGLDTLSMGMTNDLETAVHAGATMVRVGTALFGLRPAPVQTENP